MAASASCSSRRSKGIAALVTGGMVEAEQLEEPVADAIAPFLRGSRTAA
jgi:hypothetical protein